MKKVKLLISIGLISFLAAIIVLPSCKKEETPTVNAEDTAATFTLTSNGAAVNATIGRNTLTYYVQDGHVGRKLNIIGQSGVDQLSLVAACWDFQNPPMGGFKTKKYFANTAYSVSLTTPTAVITDFGTAKWQKDAKIYSNSPLANNGEFIEITSCNENAKKVSGNYKFTLKDEANADDSLIISGTFKNQTYIIVNK